MLSDGHRLHALEVRNVSFTCTLDDESTCARFFSPPQVVRTLKDVSFEAISGEVHALVGTAGSGRNLLLNVVSGSANGDTAGSVQLDNYVLSRERFTKLCSLASSRQRSSRIFTVHSLLYHAAALTFGDSLPLKTLDRRLHTLMREFDLLGYGHERLEHLSVSAQRRTLIAKALVKDPVLLLVEDPCEGLEAIACYQLLYCLKNYAAEHNRIVLISMANPRSDLCQMISSLTMLFRGEVVYSGKIQDMAGYIRDAGLSCPEKENPAMYYLSKATVNFETQETYEKTLSEAERLVDFFKTSYSSGTLPRFCNLTSSGGGTVPLCFLRRPTTATKLLVLVKLAFLAVSSKRRFLLLRISTLPALMFLLSSFSTNLISGSWISPYVSYRIFEVALLVVHCASTTLALINYGELLPLSVAESFDDLYGKALLCTAYVFAVVGVDAISSLMSAAILLWMSNVTGPAVILQMSVVFLCVFLNAHFVTMTLMLHIRDSLACSCLSLFILILWLLFGGGMLRSLTTMPFGVVAYVFYLNPIRYANCMISLEISSEVPIHNCVRSERTGIEGSSAQNFCRWSNGTAFLEESFPPSLYPQDYGTNLVVLLAIVFSLLLLTLAAHALPQPRQIVDRFRFVY